MGEGRRARETGDALCGRPSTLRDAPKGGPRGRQPVPWGPALCPQPQPPRTAAGSLSPPPRDRNPGTHPAGQPRTAAALRTPGAPRTPPIPARRKDARAGPSAGNQSDETQSTSRRTQPVPAIKGGKKNPSWRQTLVLYCSSKGKRGPQWRRGGTSPRKWRHQSGSGAGLGRR